MPFAIERTRYAAILVLCSTALSLTAQQAPSSSSKETSTRASDGVTEAILVIGLPDVKPLTKGKLRLLQEGIDFANDQVHALIPYGDITAVTIGSERTEGGGVTGKVARRIPTMGLGSVASLATMKQVDLLTIEFRDDRGSYHGVVLMLPFKSGKEIQQSISNRLSFHANSPLQPNCASGEGMLNSVLIAPLKVEGPQELPAEYRVLVYEHLYSVLRQVDLTRHYIRAGDREGGSGCTTLTLQLTVVDFNKGNQSLRAATGLLGHFIGATSLTFKVKLNDSAGHVVMEAKVKESMRGDSDSLNVANDVAKTISKRIDKAIKKEQPAA